MVSKNGSKLLSYPWIPSLGINLSFNIDGLSLLFAIVICGMGTFILLYSDGYLAGHKQLGRFYVSLLAFMASMLGVVLSDNVFTIFMFWELTSLSSYFLIGFNHEKESAQKAALQALLVTGFGGLAMLAGLILLSITSGHTEISTLVLNASSIQQHTLLLPILILILLGAFTKSAQFPFHFWLPNAMEAPTPVSAYLHSSTMVKVGIYFMARVSPIFSGTNEWMVIVTTVGAITMLISAYLAIRQTILKKILAYSTICALGIMTLLLGIGGSLGATAAVGFLFGHALYKGALFMVAGTIDHETGERDITKLGGLRRYMPITATGGIMAALSMAGIIPFLGFIGKESLYTATLHTNNYSVLLSLVSILANVAFVVVSGMVVYDTFYRDEQTTPKNPHEAPWTMWLGPLFLGVMGLILGLVPGLIGHSLIGPAASAIIGRPIDLHFVLWHGFNLELGLTAITLISGFALYIYKAKVLSLLGPLEVILSYGPLKFYDLLINGMLSLASSQTKLLQHGYLRLYILVTAIVGSCLVWPHLISHFGVFDFEGWHDIHTNEVIVILLICVGAIMTFTVKSRMAAIISLGVVGYGVGLVFILFSAPDLAMTQFIIETLNVVLFMLAFYHLPTYEVTTHPTNKIMNIVVSVSFGAMAAVLVLVALHVQLFESIASFFGKYSLSRAHGHNIVNVILVDFRGFDTLGEITVLSVAGIGAYALLKLKMTEREEIEGVNK